MQVQVCRLTFKENLTREVSDGCKLSGGPKGSGLLGGAFNTPLNENPPREIGLIVSLCSF
jgi:hypothetical protein